MEASKIRKSIIEKKSEFLCAEDVFGLRGDSCDFEIGDDCFDSSDPSGEDLRGTCSVAVTENMTDSEIEKAISDASKFGIYIYLISGDDWGKGEDTHINEIIIHDAEILAIVK